MNETEKRVVLSGGAFGVFVGLFVAYKYVKLVDEAALLKLDNMRLLTQTARLLECVEDPNRIPLDLRTDIQFRAIAFLTENDEDG